MNGVNLIPARRLEALACRVRLRRWAIAAGCYATLLATGYAACMTVLAAGASDDTSAALERATRQIGELTRSATDLRPQLTELQAKLAVARTIGDQPDWSLLLAILARAVNDDIFLTSARLEPAGGDGAMSPSQAQQQQQQQQPSQPDRAGPSSVAGRGGANNASAGMTLSVQGQATSQSAVAQFVLRLEGLGLFEHVGMIQSNRVSKVGSAAAGDNTETISFRIECRLAGNGGGPGAAPATAGEKTP